MDQKACFRCGKDFGWCADLPVIPKLPAQYQDCLCPQCLKLFAKGWPQENGLTEGDDFYYDRNLFVFTANYHLKKGYCCGNNCRHCPYEKGS